MKKIILLMVMVFTYTVVKADDNKHRHRNLSYKIFKIKKNIKARENEIENARKQLEEDKTILLKQLTQGTVQIVTK